MYSPEEETVERREAYIAALEAERESYASRKLTDRVKAVDAELARVKPKKSSKSSSSSSTPEPDADGGNAEDSDAGA